MFTDFALTPLGQSRLGSPAAASDYRPDSSYFFPLPDVLMLFEAPKPVGVYLERFSLAGTFAGDTWHETRELALGQAEYEHGAGLEWHPITEMPTALLFLVEGRKG